MVASLPFLPRGAPRCCGFPDEESQPRTMERVEGGEQRVEHEVDEWSEGQRTLMVDRIEKRLAIKLEKPGARQDCAMNPSFSSDRQITSSPPWQSKQNRCCRFSFARTMQPWPVALLMSGQLLKGLITRTENWARWNAEYCTQQVRLQCPAAIKKQLRVRVSETNKYQLRRHGDVKSHIRIRFVDAPLESPDVKVK